MAKTPYWFPAKRYGWGWGWGWGWDVPNAWQGWVVLLAFIALLVACAFLFPSGVNTLGFVACTFVLCVALQAVCLLKGEPAGWRRGK